VTDSSSEVKPNGNSVDLDRELTESTKNGLEFVMLMQFLQNKLRTMRSSITEGA
jgi:flagellar basal-body rod protein FlgB